MQDFKKITSKRINLLNIEELKKLIISISNNFSKGMDIVEQLALDRLETLITEEDFILFCDEI